MAFNIVGKRFRACVALFGFLAERHHDDHVEIATQYAPQSFRARIAGLAEDLGRCRWFPLAGGGIDFVYFLNFRAGLFGIDFTNQPLKLEA